MNELIKEIRKHAEINYEKGWDVIVEAFTDEEIAKEIAGAKTKLGAIRKLSPIVKAHHEEWKDYEAYRKSNYFF